MLDENAQGQIIERCVKWENNEERARQIVNEIKRNKEADLIVCLSNSSFMSTARSQSADEELANEVPDIDVIISAHEGPGYKEAMEVGNTLVVSAGSDTGSVGNLVLRKKSGRYELKNNKLYVMPKYERQPITKHQGKPFPKKKCKRSDVPPMYRRNRKQDVAMAILIVVDVLLLTNCILFFASL
jgi:2',3'-cyclic-nucleotide 2'-phosphodiesterase (5'-nucleotidase family)